MAFGRYLEDFEVGQVFRHWPGRTITEADDTWFSLLTMNQNPLHIDEHYARRTQHGQRLVVGTLVFSIVVGLSVADISGRAIANLEYEEIKHMGPVFHGDTLYAESQILDKRESTTKPDRQKGVAADEWYFFTSAPIGDGVVDNGKLVQLLAQAGYQGLLAVEIDFLHPDYDNNEDEAVARSVTELRRLADSA